MAHSSWLDNALDSVAQRMRAAGLQPVGYRRDGRAIWPILGGSSPADGGDAGAGGGIGTGGTAGQTAGVGAAGGATGGNAAGTGGGGAGQQGAGGDKGFPDGTPLEQMTGEQRENYWKHYARQHENRAKAYNGLTPEQVVALKEKADRHDALERELMSDKEKSVAEAKDAAEKAAAAKYQPQLARLAIEKSAAGRLTNEQLTAALAPLGDMSYFINAAGSVDADKVKTWVDGIAPATGNGSNRKGPTATGHGSGAAGSGGGREAGLAEARKRFGTPKAE